jgi:hypothetical protein
MPRRDLPSFAFTCVAGRGAISLHRGRSTTFDMLASGPHRRAGFAVQYFTFHDERNSNMILNVSSRVGMDGPACTRRRCAPQASTTACHYSAVTLRPGGDLSYSAVAHLTATTVLLLFLLAPARVNAQATSCFRSAPNPADFFSVASDADYSGTVYESTTQRCEWVVTCANQGPGFVLTALVRGGIALVTQVGAFETSNSSKTLFTLESEFSLLSEGLSGKPLVVATPGVNASSVTVYIAYLAAQGPYPPVWIDLRCEPKRPVSFTNVTLDAEATRTSVALNVTTSWCDWPATGGAGTNNASECLVEYNVSCPDPSMPIAVSWGALPDEISASFTAFLSFRPATNVEAAWAPRYNADAKFESSGPVSVRLRSNFTARDLTVALRVTCYGDVRYPICARRVVNDTIVMSTNNVLLSYTDHDSPSCFPQSTTLRLRCASTDSLVVLDHLMWDSTASSMMAVAPDGLVRLRLDAGSHYRIGQSGPSVDIRNAVETNPYPHPRLNRYNAYDLYDFRRYEHWRPNNDGEVVVRIENAALGCTAYGCGYDIRFRCQRFEPEVESYPGVDLLDMAIRAEAESTPHPTLNLTDASVPVPDDVLRGFRTPVGFKYTGLFSMMNSSEAGLLDQSRRWDQFMNFYRYNTAALGYNPGDVFAKRMPLSCGMWANVRITIHEILGLQDDVLVNGGFTHPTSDSVRFIGPNGMSNVDYQPWRTYTYAQVGDQIMGSPGEVQWTSLRPPTAGANGGFTRQINFTAECSLLGRNPPIGYPRPHASLGDSTVFMTVRSYPSDFNRVVQEEEGRLDAFSSDTDGPLTTETTGHNLTVTVLCPKRLYPCYICLKDLNAKLSVKHSLKIYNLDDGSLLTDVFASAPTYVNTLGNSLPLEQYAWGGAVVKLEAPAGTPAAGGFTMSFFPSTMDSRRVAGTSSESASLSADETSFTWSATKSPRRTGTSTVVTRTVTGSLPRPPTRTPHSTLTWTLAESVSLTASDTNIFYPPYKPTLNAAVANAVASVAGAATAVGAATSASAPPDSVLEMQALVVVSGMRCKGTRSRTEPETDEAAMGIERIAAVTGPAHESLLPFTVDTTLPEGYLLGSGILGIGLVAAHVWLCS